MNPQIFLKKTIEKSEKILFSKRDEGFNTLTKGGDPRNVVTSVDTAVNDFIIGEIKRVFPNHGIYSEEGGGIAQDNEYLWTIDPIDGTANFARGIPHYAITVGLLYRGAPEVGAVYNPITKEYYSFKKDEGAFCNGKQIFVSSVSKLSDAYVFFHTGRDKELHDWGASSLKKLLASVKKTQNFASSSLDTCFVASGKIDANIYGTLSTLDIVPAIGILLEAGGVITDEKGNDVEYSETPQKIFMANNRETIRQLREIL